MLQDESSHLFPQDRALPFHLVGKHLLIGRRVLITALSSGTPVSVSVVTASSLRCASAISQHRGVEAESSFSFPRWFLLKKASFEDGKENTAAAALRHRLE